MARRTSAKTVKLPVVGRVKKSWAVLGALSAVGALWYFRGVLTQMSGGQVSSQPSPGTSPMMLRPGVGVKYLPRSSMPLTKGR